MHLYPSQSVPFSMVMHALRTQTSPAWLNRRARPGSEIKCGRPSDPQRRPSLAYLAKRFSVLAMEASRARAGADPGSYCCVSNRRISAQEGQSCQHIPPIQSSYVPALPTAISSTYLLQALVECLDFVLQPLLVRLGLGARGESSDVCVCRRHVCVRDGRGQGGDCQCSGCFASTFHHGRGFGSALGNDHAFGRCNSCSGLGPQRAHRGLERNVALRHLNRARHGCAERAANEDDASVHCHRVDWF
mmetsp:Transcript_1975/g.12496  ORF Transcript_1975/g.12496 Transcript_1975/m.12496 type:complete len:246 (+) Transcript_1975:3774-4511(+)